MSRGGGLDGGGGGGGFFQIYCTGTYYTICSVLQLHVHA